MPRKITRTVYKFGELSEGARKNALQKLGERESECLDSADLTERIEEHVAYCHGLKLTALGKRKGDNGIYWSLGNCQGDGVAFDGLIDVDELVKPPPLNGDPRHDGQFTTANLRIDIGKIVKILEGVDIEVAVRIRHRGRYYHKNSMDVEIAYLYGDPPADADAALSAMLSEYVYEVSASAEKMGYEEIEYQTSDEEHLAELAEANGWEFEENGDIA